MDAPSIVAFVATTILACLGLSPSPNSAGIVGLLVMLQLYPKVFSRKASQFTSPWVASTIGAAMSHTRAASDALHVWILSAIILAVLSAVTSAIPIAAIYIDAQYIGRNEHRLDSVSIKVKPGYAVSVVLASQGYPGSYPKGKRITIGSVPSSESVGPLHCNRFMKSP